MEGILQDIRYGLRTLVRSPGFAVVAVLALALGIGANTAIFSVVNAVLLRPLPFRDPGRLMVVESSNPAKGYPEFAVSPPDFLDWKDQGRSFEGMAAFEATPFNLSEGSEPERVQGSRITAPMLGLLGVKPILGRDFRPEEDRDGSDLVVLLGHALWTRRFGADPAIVGRAVSINGRKRTVLGILPPEFSFPNRSEIWTPMAFEKQELTGRGAHYLNVIARIRPDATLAGARAEMQGIAERLKTQYKDTNAGWTAVVFPLGEKVVGKLRAELWVLLGAVSFVLLIACANVANLLLARATERQKEVSIRIALGAGRWRLIRQLLTENVVLGLAGGVLGLLLALWGTDLLVAAGQENLPRFREVSVDLRVLLFTLGLSLATGLVFGLVPALQTSRPDLNESLKEGGRGGTAGRARHRLRGALAVGEIALALVLLTGAGLMLKSFLRLVSVDPGFRADHVLKFDVALPGSKYGTDAQQAAFVRQALQKLGALPGVATAAVATTLPLTGDLISYSFNLDGSGPQAPSDRNSAEYDGVSPGYFHAMGIRVLKGRELRESDAAGAARVAVISDTMANRFFPGQDPIGRRIDINNGPPAWREIVGVVADVKQLSLDGGIRPHVYEPLDQSPSPYVTFVLRTSTDPAGLGTAARHAIQEIDPEQPIAGVETAEALVADSVAQPRFAMLLLGVFAGVALLLAGIGTYGVIAYSVSQRTHEFGVRMALGAGRGQVLALVVRQGALLAAAGVALGLLAAAGSSRVLAGLLFGVSPTDPITYAGVALLLTGVALLACVVPARRATRVDPIAALRCE